MAVAITNLFGKSSTKAGNSVSWARVRSDRELRQFINQRHNRLSTVDLLLDEF